MITKFCIKSMNRFTSFWKGKCIYHISVVDVKGPIWSSLGTGLFVVHAKFTRCCNKTTGKNATQIALNMGNLEKG